MNNAENQVFPLSDRPSADAQSDVYKKLPPNVSEFEHSVPRQATGPNGQRFTWCKRCGGWVAGPPHLQTKATPFVAGEQASNIFHCRRCGFPLDTGPVGGKEKTNKSGIGLEGHLRP